MLRDVLHKVATILDAILKIRNCSMMTRWHHSDSSKARSADHESVKKKTLDLSSRSKWFSAGLIPLVPLGNPEHTCTLFLYKMAVNNQIFQHLIDNHFEKHLIRIYIEKAHSLAVNEHLI